MKEKIAIFVFVLGCIVASQVLLQQSESNVRRNVYETDVLLNKSVACTSSTYYTRDLKSVSFQVVDCDSCMIYVQGRNGSSPFVNLTDSVVSACIFKIKDSLITGQMRVCLSRRGNGDTTSVRLLGTNY